MTKKQELFIVEYLKDFNATRSAIAAGYSEESAHSIGSENLNKPEIKEEIDRRYRELIGPNERIIRDNLELWRSIMASPEAAERDKLKASELIGKYAAMFQERLTINDGEPITIEVVSAKD